jgi:hypothetical protein
VTVRHGDANPVLLPPGMATSGANGTETGAMRVIGAPGEIRTRAPASGEPTDDDLA